MLWFCLKKIKLAPLLPTLKHADQGLMPANFGYSPSPKQIIMLNHIKTEGEREILIIPTVWNLAHNKNENKFMTKSL